MITQNTIKILKFVRYFLLSHVLKNAPNTTPSPSTNPSPSARPYSPQHDPHSPAEPSLPQHDPHSPSTPSTPHQAYTSVLDLSLKM